MSIVEGIEPIAGDAPADEIPNLLPAPLPQDQALNLANLAHVPSDQHEDFFDSIHLAIALVWLTHRRALGSPPGEELIRVAKAARTFHRELGKLAPIDGKWVDHLYRRTHFYNAWLRDVPETIFRLSHLFSTAAVMSPPALPAALRR